MNEIILQSILYLAVGLVVSIITVFVLKVKIFGRYWLAFIVAYVGSLIGGLLDMLMRNNVYQFLSNVHGVNIFSAVFTSIIIIAILSKLSAK
jgi:uncharacterized membrane protein YeaQ/YmgE (transglycosylase-associated protein family)